MTKEELWNLSIPKADRKLFDAIKDNWNSIAKPLDGMGRMETLLCQIGAVQGTTEVKTSPRTLIIMCGDNGVVAEGVSQSGQDVTLAVAKNMGLKKSSACKMAQCAGVDILTVDVGVNTDEEIPGVLNRKVRRGTRDFLVEPAMTEEEVLAAIETGIDMVRKCKEQGVRLAAVGEMGIGNTTTSAAVTAAILKLSAETVTGRGAGLDDAGLKRKTEVIDRALHQYKLPEDPRERAFEALRCLGGLEIAGMCGVFIGGALYHIPVVADGVISLAAALCAEKILPGTRESMLPSHMDLEPASRPVQEELQLRGVIHAEVNLGEGTGAVMLFPLLDMALAIYEGSSSFSQIGMEQYERFITET